MVNQKKKRHSTAVNGGQNANGSISNGYSQKNGLRESEDESLTSQSPRKNAAVSPSRSQKSAEHALNSSAEPTASCSTETQCFEYASDAFLAFAGSSEWSRVEAMCEMVSHLNPYELRLLSSCVEGAIRPTTSSLKHFEVRANSTDTINNMLIGGKLTFPHTIEYAFMLVSLLKSTNRGTAFAFVRLIDQLMVDRMEQLPLLPPDVRVGVIEKLGKLVSAALHHPAFSVDQRIRLANARDDLRHQLEEAGCLRDPPTPTATESTKGPGRLTYVKKFKCVADPNGNDFIIQLLWNDGLHTWVNRTRSEIYSLHLRLLDEFGGEHWSQRMDDNSNGTGVSTPTSLAPSINGTRGGSSRIIQYLSETCTEEQAVEYVNSLSDLPARMTLSAAIYEEFYSSRHDSVTQAANDSFLRATDSPPLQKHLIPATAPQTFVSASLPLSYGPHMNGRLQLSTPSCSNCAGDHAFVQCDKPNILEMSHGKENHTASSNGQISDDAQRNESPTVRMSPAFPPGLAIHHQPQYQMIIADPTQGPMFFPPPTQVLLPYPIAPIPTGQLNNNNNNSSN